MTLIKQVLSIGIAGSAVCNCRLVSTADATAGVAHLPAVECHCRDA